VSTEATRLELQIQRDHAPQIHGSLAAPMLEPVQFTGWLELISLIERMSDEHPPPSSKGAVT